MATLWVDETSGFFAFAFCFGLAGASCKRVSRAACFAPCALYTANGGSTVSIAFCATFFFRLCKYVAPICLGLQCMP